MKYYIVSKIFAAKSILLWCVFDLDRKTQEIQSIEQLSLQPDFFADRERSLTLMQRMASLRDEVDQWNNLLAKAQSLYEIQELLDESPDAELAAEVAGTYRELCDTLETVKLSLLLQGPYDSSDAILSIHVGNGGVDAQDWVEMLMRMYLRWAQKQNYKTETLDISEGEEAGLKSVTIEIHGRSAYGNLRSEAGVHRLIRLSPFNAAHLRQTSFAKVELLPDIAQNIEIVVRPEDIEVDTYRSTGAGGQHVNKTDSAVRIRHKATGIVVTCQNERSQIQNREVAMRILKAKLFELEERKRAEQEASLRGKHVDIAFGSQIRTVTLQPYTLVKDHRTGAETANTTGYLDGDLDTFIRAFLEAQVN